MIYIIASLGVICTVQAYYLYRFASTILKTEQDIEVSLDVIDDSYQKITLILEKPLFYDSAEVRQILMQLKNSRGALLYVANRMSGSDDNLDGEVNA
jgi:hypothetical protein